MPAELEELLRRSLHAQADRVEPGTDGLRRIRERTVRPARLRWRWRTPVLVLAGAAAVVCALVAAPSVLPALTPPPAATSAAMRTAPGPTPIAAAGVNDMRTVWPYGTRADAFRDTPAAQAAGTYGDLTKPDRLALRFVASYLGPDSLSARSRGAHLAGIRIEVSRAGMPISLVYLVRVRVGDDAPYVVVEAEAPDGSLALDRIPPVSGGSVTARGTLGAPARLAVRLRAPGRDQTLSRADRPEPSGAWSQRLRVPPGTAAAVTAWTTGASGVTAFVARPVGA